MRKIDVVLLALLLAFAGDSAYGQEACYDYQTGNITFHQVGGLLGLTAFAPESVLRKSEATDFGGIATAVDISLAGSISWANFGGFPAGKLDAGKIIVPGTDPELLIFVWHSSFSHGPPLSVKVINLPEPGTFLLAVLGTLGCYSSFQHRQVF